MMVVTARKPNSLRPYDVHERLADRRAGGDRDDQGGQDHQQPEADHRAVQGQAGLLAHEDPDGEQRGQRSADPGVEPEHRLGAQAAAGDVADVEHQAAEHDEPGEQVADAGEHPVAELVGAQAGDPDHPPDVELHGDVHDHREHDRAGERGAELDGEGRGLGDEARADGAGGHQEDGAEQGGARELGLLAGPRLGAGRRGRSGHVVSSRTVQRGRRGPDHSNSIRQ